MIYILCDIISDTVSRCHDIDFIQFQDSNILLSAYIAVTCKWHNELASKSLIKAIGDCCGNKEDVTCDR